MVGPRLVGALDGEIVGPEVGGTEGAPVKDGARVGGAVGVVVGSLRVGMSVGMRDGHQVGTSVLGASDGIAVRHRTNSQHRRGQMLLRATASQSSAVSPDSSHIGWSTPTHGGSS